MKRVSYVIPVHNNFKYTKHIYENLKLYYPDDEIVISDGGSNDETIDYFTNINDDNLVFVNNGKLNLCENYNKGVDSSTSDVIVLLHNDMFIPPNFKTKLLKDLDDATIISYARIEPPVFPGEEPGKVVRDFGFDLDTLDKNKIIEFSENYNSSYEGGGYLFIACNKDNWIKMDETTFNPPQMWAADDDLHVRFRLSNFKLLISDAIVYHFVSKTSRADSEYREVEFKSNRNYVRKWGTRSIESPTYDIAFVLNNADPNLLQMLEPWCNRIFVDMDYSSYILYEQQNTKYDLTKRIHSIGSSDPREYHDIIVEIDAKNINDYDLNIIQNLAAIIKNSGEAGYEFKLGNLKINIQHLNEYQNTLIHI